MHISKRKNESIQFLIIKWRLSILSVSFYSNSFCLIFGTITTIMRSEVVRVLLSVYSFPFLGTISLLFKFLRKVLLLSMNTNTMCTSHSIYWYCDPFYRVSVNASINLIFHKFYNESYHINTSSVYWLTRNTWQWNIKWFE